MSRAEDMDAAIEQFTRPLISKPENLILPERQARLLAEEVVRLRAELADRDAEAQNLRAEMESMAVAFDRTIAVYEGQS